VYGNASLATQRASTNGAASFSFLPEPAIVVIRQPRGRRRPERARKDHRHEESSRAFRYAANLKLLHFSSCLVGLGRERAPFPVSGYATSVDWGASALLEFTYLDLILNRGMDPAHGRGEAAAARSLRRRSRAARLAVSLRRDSASSPAASRRGARVTM
jgi:hypothetical protein